MSKIITTQYEQTDLNFIIDHASYSIVYDAHKSHSMVNNTWYLSSVVIILHTNTLNILKTLEHMQLRI